MATPKRILTKWRKEALIRKEYGYDPQHADEILNAFANQILILTQELLDQHLLKETVKS